jgi:hypothetical protein
VNDDNEPSHSVKQAGSTVWNLWLARIGTALIEYLAFVITQQLAKQPFHFLQFGTAVPLVQNGPSFHLELGRDALLHLLHERAGRRRTARQQLATTAEAIATRARVCECILEPVLLRVLEEALPIAAAA